MLASVCRQQTMRKTLFIAARSSQYSIRTKAPGI